MSSSSFARATPVIAIAAVMLVSTGCSMIKRPDGSLRFLPQAHNSEYTKSRENRPLDVPPDLDTPATDPTMQVPAVGAVASAAASGPTITLADTPASSWERLGKALDHVDGVSVGQRSQLLGSYEVQYKGASMLLRATGSGTSTSIDAVTPAGQPLRTPEALELLGLLRNRLG
ncbi:MAG: hypothetical protein JSR34_01300 [Proteobacteria bacterium]|nr:hypothetical protein [Pseudomonadota bacterium]